MNILNRPMFSRGDVVSTPTLSQEVLKTLEELGINPKNKTTEQLSAELDSYIAQEKRRIVFDPTDPLDVISAGLTATGIGAGAGLGIKALRTGVKGKKAVDKIGKLQKIKNLLNPNLLNPIKTNPGKVTPGPLGMANIASPTKSIKIPQSTIYGGVAVDAINPDDETNLNKALGINIEEDTQEELNRLQAPQNKEKLEKAKKKAKDKKDEKEIKRIENAMNAQLNLDKVKSQKYQEQKKRKTARNLNIFLENMSASMAGTDNLADGLSIGAANAAKAVGDADEAEALAYLNLEEKTEEKNASKEVTDADWLRITKRYQESVQLVGKQENLVNIVTQLKKMTIEGNTTGGRALAARIVDDIAGFTGLGDRFVSEATKAVNAGKYLTAQSITQILQEGGKTVSDRDRELIRDIMANFESWFMGRGEAVDSLNRVLEPMLKAFQAGKDDIESIDSRYGKQIPELETYKRSLSTYGPKTEEIESVDDADLQLTQEDLID
tara:strand:+ start:195 stop:1679 length:1485 start_codon:yes stop_codon:yes gene_type:complete